MLGEADPFWPLPLGGFGDLGKVTSLRGQTLNSTRFLGRVVTVLVPTALTAHRGWRKHGWYVLELLVCVKLVEPSSRPWLHPHRPPEAAGDLWNWFELASPGSLFGMKAVSGVCTGHGVAT